VGSKEEFMVQINGKNVNAEGMTIAEYLDAENYNVKQIAVEYNLEIISKEQYGEIKLKDGDEVEIVSFMGGGCCLN
jgi:sulfur carrier protein